MKPKTIISLYNGDYAFVERDSPPGERHSKSLSKCVEVENKLKELIDKSTFYLIMKAMDFQNDFIGVEIEAAFVESFSLIVICLSY